MNPVASALVAMGIATFGLFPTEAGSQQRLTYASFMPPGHVVHTDGLQPFFERIERETDGALTFELLAGGAMGGGRAMLSVVRDGLVDSAIIIDLFVRRDLPASNALSELGLLGEDTLVMNGAVSEFQLLDCPACEDERARNDVKGLAFYSTPPFYLMCNRPVERLADVEGLRVRAPGPFGFWVQAMGGVPVAITPAELYEAMQRGQVDCTIGSLAWLSSYNLIDLVTDIVDLPMGTYHGALVFNMNVHAWTALSEEHRAVIRAALPELSRLIAVAYERDDVQARKLAEEKGVRIHAPDPALEALLARYREAELERVIEKAGEEGIENARELILAFVEKVELWSGLVADIDHDPNRYEELLRERVFSRLE